MKMFDLASNYSQEIKIGDRVTNNKVSHRNIDGYFEYGPGIVLDISPGPEYAGGKFVAVKLSYGETMTFYFNALKKV